MFDPECLECYLRLLHRDTRFALEFRHPSWFIDGRVVHMVFKHEENPGGALDAEQVLGMARPRPT